MNEIVPNGAPPILALQSSDHGRKILYAEDDDILRELLGTILSKSGFTVVSVADGRVAWDTFLGEPFDLVICDQEMPGMFGLELIARIRRENRHVPVLLVSSSADALTDAECNQVQLNDRLQKPFSSKALLQAVTRLLLKRPADRTERSLAH